MDANDVRRIALDAIFDRILYSKSSKDKETPCATEAEVRDLAKAVFQETGNKDG